MLLLNHSAMAAASSVGAMLLCNRNGVTTRGQQHSNGIDVNRAAFINGINGSCKQLSICALENNGLIMKIPSKLSPSRKLSEVSSSPTVCSLENNVADGEEIPELTPHKESAAIDSRDAKDYCNTYDKDDFSHENENISPPHLIQMVFKEEKINDGGLINDIIKVNGLSHSKRGRYRANINGCIAQMKESNSTASLDTLLPPSSSCATLVDSSTCDCLNESSSNSDVESTSQSAVLPRNETDSDNCAVQCSWDGCDVKLLSPALADHLRQCHVDTQTGSEFVSCLWHGCKVYRRESRSRVWLETHVLRHAGNKPFCCIVDGCGQRFASRRLLERHVNAHLNKMSQQNQSYPKMARNRDEARLKLLKRKKLQVARPWAAKVADFFDAHTMEHLYGQLLRMHTVSGIDLVKSRQHVTFCSEVIAKRSNESGEPDVLLQWHPENVLPDEWVPESQRQQKRQQVCALSNIPSHCITNVDPALYRPHRFRKQRRK